jgi:hypothetical protein
MYTQNKLQVEINRRMPENVDLQKRSWVRNAIVLDSAEYGGGIPVFQEVTDLQDNQVQREHFAQIPSSGIRTKLKGKQSRSQEAEKVQLLFPVMYNREVGF